MSLQLSDIFGNDGILAQALGPRYRARSGQLAMAEQIAAAVATGHHAVIEAGTGIGKTFAYVIPALLPSKRILVSTANKALQSQLIDKDLPFLQSVLPRRFNFALLKGRSNYLCNLRLADLMLDPTGSTDLDALHSVNVQLLGRPDGDLDYFQVTDQLRQEMTVGHEDCLGDACRFHRECYFEQARSAAEAAQVVVINHALLARSILGQGPKLRDVVIIDEAHELARYVVEALGSQVTLNRITRVLHGGFAQAYLLPDELQKAETEAKGLFTRLARVLSRLDNPRVSLVQADLLAAGRSLAHDLNAIAETLERAIETLPDDDATRPYGALAVRRASNLAAAAKAAFAEQAPADQVRFIEALGEAPRQRVQVSLQPVSVAELLYAALFRSAPTVVCTSATLTFERSFQFFRESVGLRPDLAVTEAVIDSPYDYARQGLLYIPGGLMPAQSARDARSQAAQRDFLEQLQAEIVRLLEASQGRALVLFTSTQRMRACHAFASERVSFTCYLQGALPKTELLQRFQSEVASVLFATRSFWAGVDVAGESLSLVIVERPPFPSPSDPVYARQCELIARQGNGANGWDALAVPQAALELRQGVGRLIRHETDRGVAAILDSRLLHKPYGRRILASLPFRGYTSDLAQVAAFLARPGATPPAPQPELPAGPAASPPAPGQPAPPAAPVRQPAPAPRPAPRIGPAPLPQAAPQQPAPPGAPQLAGYRLIRQLGHGGFGAVYEAEQLSLGRRVAIKALRPEVAADENALARFILEARTAASLDHPNIVKVLDLITAGGRFYIVMEFLGGGTLQDRLDRGPLPVQQVIEVGIDLCRALAVVHARQIVHRDIKPQNILFAANNATARLTDFGIAHVPKDAAGPGRTLTRPGLQPGTVVYMSPEQIQGGLVDGRSDLYSLAVVLYEALTGTFYLDLDGCETLYQVQQQIIHAAPKPIAELARFPAGLVAAILRSLAKLPAERFASADALRAALEQGADAAPAPAAAPQPPAPQPAPSPGHDSVLRRLLRTLHTRR